MKLALSTSSTAKTITLSMALLAVLTSINTPITHAAPVTKAAPAPATNGVQQGNSETPRVPAGPRGPLLHRRSIHLANNEGLGQTHPKAPERPEPSGGGEVELVSVGAVVSHGNEKRHDWEQGWDAAAAAVEIKRDGSKEEKSLQISSKLWWWQDEAITLPAGGEGRDVAINAAKSKKAKRGDEEEEEAASLWLWNGKAEGGAAKDGVEGFKVRVVAKSHIRGDRASRRAGGDTDDSRWKFKKREIHQGGVNGLTGVDEWVGLPERRLMPSKKRALDATHEWNGGIEKRRFRKWNFKRGDEGGEVGSEGDGKIEVEKRRWHW
ncbi:hypothetical protein BGZ97_002795 [Linnemannia gamsii]|uniref:Uncharacterized protein n=1 Tax=Linnemannia gamsii TaxID=64522 RepID=A0A9P6QWL7_9FUNG|nr:hypothetical protein BGZ97_002795 [Linnemannia gamsii]